MYKINVKSEGKNFDVTPGNRYTLSKRNAKKIIAFFLEYQCDIEVTKFLKCGNCWGWSKDHNLYGGYGYQEA